MRAILKLCKNRKDCQIFAQCVLLFIGVIFLGFTINFTSILILIASSLVTQYLFSCIFKIKFKLKSPIITGLALSILLRSEHIWIFFLAAFLSIASKFLIRVQGKHIFNPAVFGIIASINLSNLAWIAPGQWGSIGWVICIIIICGMLVANQSKRADLSITFIIAYLTITISRSIYLEEEAIFCLLELENAAMLTFAFFTLSDPETTPTTRPARVFFGVLVACVTLTLKLQFNVNYDLLYTLFFTLPLVPLINYHSYRHRITSIKGRNYS